MDVTCALCPFTVCSAGISTESKYMQLEYNHAHVFAPATIANVGPGFDILGLALEQPGDEVEIRAVPEPGIRILEITGDHGILPLDPEKNTATVAIKSMVKDLDISAGLEVGIHKKMPIGSGMGSSAASSVAGAFALNALLAQPLKNRQLLKYALEGEKISSGGSVHLDNIAACLYGGFILVRSKNPLDIISLPVPENLRCVIIHPQIEIKTSESRKLLKKETTLEAAVMQWANVAGLVSALYEKDFSLLARSLQDAIAEPVRSILIPAFEEMKSEALKKGAIGFSISGSGPSVFAFCDSDAAAEHVGEQLQSILNQKQIQNDLYITRINPDGPKIIELA